MWSRKRFLKKNRKIAMRKPFGLYMLTWDEGFQNGGHHKMMRMNMAGGWMLQMFPEVNQTLKQSEKRQNADYVKCTKIRCCCAKVALSVTWRVFFFKNSFWQIFTFSVRFCLISNQWFWIRIGFWRILFKILKHPKWLTEKWISDT